ncbi:hypothetical protein XBFM1_190001 [Xenorhabdus bovienii str. feltiae Moldova]|uniref:Uncharacterized protein n=1 Tax=Xenorhabdus bovienii str. feltiae Moldova TaxID=1398200 RepID=A0A077NQX1_XENBV|nr:hypothetical protein XBFM1_190001 [Xenorhabdus bovienii str. feltiae Moldova]
MGAVDGLDIRKKLADDKESSYFGLDINEEDYGEADPLASETGTLGGATAGAHEGQAAALPGGHNGPLST